MDKAKGYVAVAIVVDSSSTVLTQWRDVLQLYVSQLLSRLVSSGDRHILLGFVTYANAESRPTPILAKRFFTHPTQLINELRDDSQRLCLGRTGMNGSSGLAALEGYAAALDMFDILLPLASQDNDRPSQLEKSTTQEQRFDSHHIIHITAYPPDSNQNPLWNQSSDLDALSWRTLPEELTRRNIGLNLILLKDVPHFTELHASILSSVTSPWFEIRAGHQVLLCGFPAPPAKASLSKRTVDEAVPPLSAGPDTKRTKTNAQESAPVPKTSPPSIPQAPATTQPTARNASSQPPGMPSQVPSMPMMAQLLHKNQTLETQLKTMYTQMQAAQQSGRMEEAEKIKAEIGPLFQNFRKLREYLSQFRSLAAQRAGNGGPAVDTETQHPPSQPAQNNGISPSEQPSQSQQQLTAKFAEEPRRLPNEVQTKLLHQLLSQNPSILQRLKENPLHPPHEVKAQLQKLLQQHSQAQQNVQRSIAAHQQGSVIPQPQATALQMRDKQRWHGTLSWTGHDSIHQVRKEVSAQVVAVRQKGASIRPDLWPSNVRLIPAPERFVQAKVLMDWIRRHDPPICKVHALSMDSDSAQNDSNFNSLITLLLEKGMYALGSWNQPSETLNPNIVIFPTDSSSLAAAIFPETGAPDLPKAINVTQQQTAQPPPSQQLLPSPEIQQNPARPMNVYPKIPSNAQSNAMLQYVRSQQMGMGMNPNSLAGGMRVPYGMGSQMGMVQPGQTMPRMPSSGVGTGGMMMEQGGVHREGGHSNPVNLNIDMIHSFMKQNFGPG